MKIWGKWIYVILLILCKYYYVYWEILTIFIYYMRNLLASSINVCKMEVCTPEILIYL